MRCGLIGRRLAHSFSPAIHRELADYPYELCELEPGQVEDFVRKGPLDAFNVTIPYKETVLPMMDALSERAARIGSVNTVVRRADGTLFGDNTDADGMLCMLSRPGFEVAGKKVLVLGSGGSCRTALAVLERLGARPVVISRRGENNYQNLSRHADAAYVLNTTPVGMYPANGERPLDIAAFPVLEGVADLIYNPARTRLLLDAEDRGLATVNGLPMLVEQARAAAEIFTGRPVPQQAGARILRKISFDMQNVLLIGMPGCGKSTQGAALAAALGRPFADADAELEAAQGRSIPDIIKNEGESAFRAMETAALAALCARSGQVIACGGGVVTRAENRALLHQNGIILYLERPTEQLAVEGRPLSLARTPEVLARERLPLYEAWADVRVRVEGTAESVTEHILEVLRK